MTTKKPAPSDPETRFEFLNPLDGEKYMLPPFKKELVVDALAGHEDDLTPIPSMHEALMSGTRHAFQSAIEARQEDVGWMMTQGMLQTFDAHIPDPDDPAKAAIIANVNASEFKWLWETYGKWIKASGEAVDNEQGEG